MLTKQSSDVDKAVLVNSKASSPLDSSERVSTQEVAMDVLLNSKHFLTSCPIFNKKNSDLGQYLKCWFILHMLNAHADISSGARGLNLI